MDFVYDGHLPSITVGFFARSEQPSRVKTRDKMQYFVTVKVFDHFHFGRTRHINTKMNVLNAFKIVVRVTHFMVRSESKNLPERSGNSSNTISLHVLNSGYYSRWRSVLIRG